MMPYTVYSGFMVRDRHHFLIILHRVRSGARPLPHAVLMGNPAGDP